MHLGWTDVGKNVESRQAKSIYEFVMLKVDNYGFKCMNLLLELVYLLIFC